MPYKIKNEFINNNKFCKLTCCGFYMKNSLAILEGNTTNFKCSSSIRPVTYCYPANRLRFCLSQLDESTISFTEFMKAISVFEKE